MKMEARRLSQKLAVRVLESFAVKMELHPLMAAGGLLIPDWVNRVSGNAFKAVDKMYPGQLATLRADGREILLRFMVESEAHERVTEKCKRFAESAANAITENGDVDDVTVSPEPMVCEDEDLLLIGAAFPSVGSASANGLYATAEEEFCAYEEYCSTLGPLEDCKRSGYK